jgi:hypothetical protein
MSQYYFCVSFMGLISLIKVITGSCDHICTILSIIYTYMPVCIIKLCSTVVTYLCTILIYQNMYIEVGRTYHKMLEIITLNI